MATGSQISLPFYLSLLPRAVNVTRSNASVEEDNLLNTSCLWWRFELSNDRTKAACKICSCRLACLRGNDRSPESPDQLHRLLLWQYKRATSCWSLMSPCGSECFRTVYITYLTLVSLRLKMYLSLIICLCSSVQSKYEQRRVIYFYWKTGLASIMYNVFQCFLRLLKTPFLISSLNRSETLGQTFLHWTYSTWPLTLLLLLLRYGPHSRLWHFMKWLLCSVKWKICLVLMMFFPQRSIKSLVLLCYRYF